MPGRIPKEFIDELLLRVDIVEVIDARVPLKKAGKDYKACCPFHDEKTPSFTVSPAKQFYHCFGCGAHGTAIGFLMEYEHQSFPEAVEELAGRVGLQLPRESLVSSEKTEASANLFRVLEDAVRYYRSQLRAHAPAIEYLKRRGISGEIAAAFGLGYAPDGWDHLVRVLGKEAPQRELLIQAGLAVRKEGGGCYDRFRDRVMFPIHDYRGRIIGFGGRVIGKGEPKYLNSPETPLFHKGKELYGLYRARDAIRSAGRVIVVEGYMDVVGLAQFGIDNAVATLGTATTREHLERLFRFAQEVVFCFDGDRAGREAAWRALEAALPILHEGRQISFAFLPEGEDPDSLVRVEGAQALQDRLGSGLSLPEYFFQTLGAKVDLGRLDGRARLVELATPLLSKMPAGAFQQMMLDRLADISRIPSTAAAERKTAAGPSGRDFRRNYAGPKPPPSVVRVAAALLVQNPALIAEIDDPELLGEADLPGMEVFQKIVQLLREQPRLNTAALIEHFRESEHEPVLARLATWSHSSLAQDVRAEFQGALSQLRLKAIETVTDRLVQKGKVFGLSEAEKTELNRLLTAKQEIRQTAPTH